MKLELNIDTFKGKVFDEINVSQDENEIIFKEKSGKIYKMFHEQDCCESVTIEDICGDLKSLLNTPILHAEESSKRGDDEDCDSSTWTFYKLATVNGWVDIRWFGSSNGYYSESVSIYEYEPEELEEEEDDTPLNIAEETMEKVKFLLNYLDYDGLCSLTNYIEEMKEEEFGSPKTASNEYFNHLCWEIWKATVAEMPKQYVSVFETKVWKEIRACISIVESKVFNDLKKEGYSLKK